MTPAELTALRETIMRSRGYFWNDASMEYLLGATGEPGPNHPDQDPAFILETLEAMMRDGHEVWFSSAAETFFITGISAPRQSTLALAVCAAYPVWCETKRKEEV